MAELHVMIAEDEPLVARILEKNVQKYAADRGGVARVRIFGDGFQAAVAAQHPKVRWDLLLLDYRLPRLDGEGVWRAIAQVRPELLARVLFVTQAGEELKMEHEGVPVPILAKPFTYPRLAAALDRLLVRRR